MTLPRCFLLAVVFCAAGNAAAQVPPAPGAPAAAAAPFAGDERAAKLVERYRAMLAANPTEGIVLDRLWKAYEDRAATAALIAEYRAAADRSGGVAAWLIYGHLLKKTGRFDDAAAAYEAAGKAGPASPLPLLARGDLALGRQQPEDAAPLFDEALTKLPPNDPLRADLRLKLGSAWLAAGQPAKAAESWEQLSAANPANLALHKQLAETYARSHLIDKALGHYEYIDRHGEPAARAAALREAGGLRENRGEFDAARDAYERGLALTARDNWLHGELLRAIIRLHERAGRTAELLSRWQRAAEESPRDLGGLLRLEMLAEAQGDTKGELEWLDRITTLAPRDRDSRLKLARLLVDHGERERAAAVYDQLLKDQPEQLDLIFARADLDLQLGAVAAAVSRVEARLAKSPADETAAESAREFFVSRHLDEPAEKSLRAAVARQPGALEPGIALAKFLFARRRTDEGRRVLDQLTGNPAAGTPLPERWQRIANVYKDENLPADALRCWQEAATLAPRDPVPLEAASELLLARGEPRAAASALEKAVAAAPEGAVREEAEHKLFQVLSIAAGNTAPGMGGPGTASIHGHRWHPRSLPKPGPPGIAPAPGSDAVLADSPLDQYIAGLEKTADEQPTSGNLLRLARWQTWARLPNEASASAGKAVALDPANLAARRMLIRLAMEERQHVLAADRLHEIIALDPANRSAYLRDLAGMQMEDGEYDAALAGYRQLQEAQPGAVEPLSDLALAEQRADRWFDALATWKRADALPTLTPAQRADIRRPLLAVYEHLGEFRPAAELLARAVDEQPELARKQELFQELSEFCGQHALEEWLDSQYEARLRAQPDDYFTMVAVAQLWKNKGRDEDAYRLLAQAYYCAPDPVAALKSLADEAEALGESGQAVVDRRRLAGLAGQDTAENLERLAASEEDDLDEGGAARTWEQVVSRFPRDTDALTRAAAFFERIAQPERARALLDRLVAIEPGDLTRLCHLAELARDAGDDGSAREKFEAVLARSTAEKPGGPLLLPSDLEATPEPSAGPGGVAVAFRAEPPASAPGSGSGSDDHAVRLAAIRGLAALLPAGGDARVRWRERWRTAAAAGARSEPLQAFYASGDVAATMDLLAGWMSAQPKDERLRDTFLLAGLKLEDYGPLAHWAWPDSDADQRAVRGPQLVESLQRFLAAGGKPGANMANELFPPQVRARDLLWKAAKEGFAERRWYEQAAELGERVAVLTASSRSNYAVEVAGWRLFIDQPDRARAILREAANEGGGASLDGSSGSAVYEALRAYYLLLPPGERTAFVDRYLREWQTRNEPVHRVLSALLLHGLQGDELDATQEVDALLAMRLSGAAAEDRSADARYWSYVLGTGIQLENWNLPSLAASLWRRALRQGTAFERRDSEVSGIQADVHSRLVVLEVTLAANSEESRERVTAYLADSPPADLVRSVAARLLAGSYFPAARQCYEFLTRQEPTNGENWRDLLGTCEAAGDADATEQILSALLAAPPPVPTPLNRAELVRDLASVHQAEGDNAGALRLLEREFHTGVRSAPVVVALASAYERAGMLGDAARVWQEAVTGDYGNARIYRLSLARLEERRGDLPQAISMMEAEVSGTAAPGMEEAAIELAGLYLRTGRSEQARNLALPLLKTNDPIPVAGIVRAFDQAGQPALIREWLRTAMRRSHDPPTRFVLQRQLLQQNPAVPAEAPADFAREMSQLRKIADGTPALKPAYVEARYALARQHGADRWLEAELQREWRGGLGDFSAGEQLFNFYLDTHQVEPLRRLVRLIDERPNLPEPSLASMETRLTDAGLAELALPVSERLLRRFPQNEQYVLGRARVLWRSGRIDEANRQLEALDGGSVFRGDLSARIGAVYEELGEEERACTFYGRAVQRDPAGTRSAAAGLRLVQMETQRKNWPSARRLLLREARHPAATADLTSLVDFLQASGALDGEVAPAWPDGSLPLTVTKRAQLLALIYQRLKSLGRLPEAQAMVAAHPGFLAFSPQLTAAWRQDATPAQVPAFIGMLEDAASLAGTPNPRLRRDLAALYLRWSDDEANTDPRDAAGRLDHLLRARQFAPDDFEVARRLAVLCWEDNRGEQAVSALQPFLADDAVPFERQQARELLARH